MISLRFLSPPLFLCPLCVVVLWPDSDVAPIIAANIMRNGRKNGLRSTWKGIEQEWQDVPESIGTDDRAEAGVLLAPDVLLQPKTFSDFFRKKICTDTL